MTCSSSSSTGPERRRRRRSPSPRGTLARRARARARAGLSLVELIVVLGIVALLAGLLVPALGGVRASARATTCRSNLRQMALAAHQHAMLHDRWPGAIDYQRRDGRLVQAAWDWVTGFGGGEVIEPGPLWALIGDPGEVMQCPDYHGETNFDDPHTGYNYNTSFLGAEEAFALNGDGPVRDGVRPHACARSSTCAAFGDGGVAGGTNKFMRSPSYRESEQGFNIGLAAIYRGGQAFRHAGGTTNVAYLDGHVEARDRPHEGMHASPALLRDHLGFPDNGFLSDDDSAYDPR